MAPPLAPSSQESAPTASVLVEVRLPPQVALHRLASPLVGLEHDVVGLVGEPRPAVLDGQPRLGPRARAALEDAHRGIPEAVQGRGGGGGGAAGGGGAEARPLPLRRERPDCPLEPAATEPAGTGHVAARVRVALVDAEDQSRAEIAGIDARDALARGFPAEGDDGRVLPLDGAAGGGPCGQAAGEHGDVGEPHAAEPRGGHHGAREAVADEDDRRGADRDVLVGRLHRLAPGRPDGAGDVARGVFVGRPYVEDVEVAVALAPGEAHGEIIGRDEGQTILGRDALRRQRGDRAAPGGRRRRPARRAALEREPRELPAHRLVLERDHGVGELHPPERLGADVGARAATAVNDDRRLGAPDQLGDADDQLAARDAPGAGDTTARVLLGRPRVDDDQVVTALDPLLELVGRELRRLALVQGALTEDFARHVDALDERTLFRAPGGEATGEDPHVGVAHLSERRPRQRGEPSVLVADDEWRPARGDDPQKPKLQEPPRERRGAIDVTPLVGRLLAQVEQGVGRRGLRQPGEFGGGDHAERPSCLCGRDRASWNHAMDFPEALRALNHRDFRVFWGGQLVSLIGTWMQSVAQSWLVLQLSGSPLKLGLIGTLQFAPVLLFSVVAGAIADRLPKRRLILATQSALALQAFTITALVWSGHVRYWHVAVLALLLGCANVIDMPTRQAFVAELVGKRDLVNAVALNSAAFNGARIVGPAVAGLLIGRFGVAPAFLLNGLSFLVVIGALLLVHVEGTPRPRAATTVGQEVWQGLRYALDTPRIALILGLVLVVSLCVFNFTTSTRPRISAI